MVDLLCSYKCSFPKGAMSWSLGKVVGVRVAEWKLFEVRDCVSVLDELALDMGEVGR